MNEVESKHFQFFGENIFQELASSSAPTPTLKEEIIIEDEVEEVKEPEEEQPTIEPSEVTPQVPEKITILEEEEKSTEIALPFSNLFASSISREQIFSSELKAVCYVEDENKAPILKFSKLFSTPVSTTTFEKSTRSEKSKDYLNGVEIDEEETYFQNVDSGDFLQQSWKRRSNQPKSIPSINSDSFLMSKPLKEKFLEERKSISQNILASVEQQSWEDKIVWDGGKQTQETKKNDGVIIEGHISIELDLDEAKPYHWGTLKEDHVVNSLKQPPKKKRLLKDLNEELIYSDDWFVSSIIWNTDQPHDQFPTKLILDTNDDKVFPETVDKLFEKTEKVARKRKVSHLTDARFNLSNDDYYESEKRVGATKKTLKKTDVIHSEPALKLTLMKTALSDEDLDHFHRPLPRLQPGQTYKVSLVKKEKEKFQNEQNRMDTMKIRHRTDLSVTDGRFVLMEYVEEHPLIVMNFGMGTKVKIYYRKRTPNENPLLKFDDGETVLLDPKDISPFLGDIEPGKTIQALDNRLFRAPIFKHQTDQTDFLLIRTGDKAYIREIPAVYTVGQLQPKMEVPAPNSRAANTYMKNRLQAYIYRLFLKKSTMRLKISDVMKLFPGISETSIRKRFKDCADFQRGGDDSGWWTVKDQSLLPNEEDLRTMITPEMVSLYESMLMGQYRLKSVGITQFCAITPYFSSALQQIKETDEDILVQACRSLEDELLLTPWNLTGNFVNAMQGKGLLQLSGLGDPSGGRGEAFSYVRMPQKNTQPQSKKESSKKEKTGHKGDLRKLSLEKATEWLRNYGVPQAEIDKLKRWEMIDLIRKKSNEVKASGEGGEMIYARESRYSLHQQQEQYRDKVQLIFNNQVKALAHPNPEFSDDEDEEDVIDSYASNLENMLINAETKKQQRTRQEKEEEAERATLAELKKQYDEAGTYLTNETSRKEFVPPESGTYVKKKKKIRHEDGTVTYVYEYITDFHEVQEFIRSKEIERERKRKELEGKNKKPQLTAEEEEERKVYRRKKKRLQEKLRRLSRDQKTQEELKRILESGQIPSDPNAKFKCGACGLPGHMRTNRICPLYDRKTAIDDDDEEDEELESSNIPYENVKVEGNKLKFSKPSSLVLKIPTQGLSISQKRAREEDILHRPHRRRRGTTGAQVSLSNIFEDVCLNVVKSDLSTPFRKPVSIKEAPDYYDVIKEPMDISTIKSKARDNRYASREEFIADFELMAENCHQYNKDRNPHLPALADHVVKLCRTELEKRNKEVEELENILKPSEEDGSKVSTPSLDSSSNSLYVSQDSMKEDD